MSVPVGQRSESKLEVFTRATALVKYTLEITTNRKVFTPRYDVLTRRIIDAAMAIGEYIWRANDIQVRTAEDLAKRRGLQADALVECDALLYNITLAKGVFHLSGKRVEYWSGQVRDIKAMIRKWRESDRRRFGGLESGT